MIGEEEGNMARNIRISGMLMAGSLATPVYAGPIIFSCQTESGKFVTFSDEGSGVRYSYGRQGFPDLAMTPMAGSSTMGSQSIMVD